MEMLDHRGWSDDHDDADVTTIADEMIWERPRTAHIATFVPRIGIGGLSDDLTLAYALPLLERFIAAAGTPLVIVDAPDGWDHAATTRRPFPGDIDRARIVGVSSDAPPAPMALIEAVAAELTARFPEANTLLLIAGADIMPVAFDPTLVHYTVGVVDATALPRPLPPALLSVDCLILHAPAETRSRMRAAIADVVAVRGHMPTPVVMPANARDLDAVFGIVWTDLFGS